MGTNDAMVRNSTGLFSGHIAASGIRETDVARLAMPWVQHVLVRRQLPVILRHGSMIEPVALIGIDPEREQEATALPRKTVAGRYPVAGKAAIFISQDTADRLGLAPGDTVTVADDRPLRPYRYRYQHRYLPQPVLRRLRHPLSPPHR